MSDEPNKTTLLTLAAQIVAAHVSHNTTTAEALPTLITSVINTLSGTGSATAAVVAAAVEPAVPVKKSVFADHIVCLDCGKHFSMMKRHLDTDHDLAPDAYRAKWGLPRDYPMVAGDYAKRRSVLAKKIGLGRRAGQAAQGAAKVKVTVLPERKRGRPRKTA